MLTKNYLIIFKTLPQEFLEHGICFWSGKQTKGLIPIIPSMLNLLISSQGVFQIDFPFWNIVHLKIRFNTSKIHTQRISHVTHQLIHSTATPYRILNLNVYTLFITSPNKKMNYNSRENKFVRGNLFKNVCLQVALGESDKLSQSWVKINI